MTVIPKRRPTFFMVPDEKVDYKPSLQLGRVIYRVTEPDLLLFPSDDDTPTIPLGVEASEKKLENYKITKNTGHTSKYGLVAKILDFLVNLVNISRGAQYTASETYEVANITFHTFKPGKTFLKELEAQEDVADYLNNDADAAAFLITGIVIGEGIVFKHEEKKNVDKEATVGVKIPEVADIGPTAKVGDSSGDKIDYEDKGPTLLAFRVQKLKMKDGKLTATTEVDGAHFGDDAKGPREVDFDASLEGADIEGFTAEDVTDDLIGEECTLYFPK